MKAGDFTGALDHYHSACGASRAQHPCHRVSSWVGGWVGGWLLERDGGELDFLLCGWVWT
jgi:hypothetical protein